jgi:hypothetical protein
MFDTVKHFIGQLLASLGTALSGPAGLPLNTRQVVIPVQVKYQPACRIKVRIE